MIRVKDFIFMNIYKFIRKVGATFFMVRKRIGEGFGGEIWVVACGQRIIPLGVGGHEFLPRPRAGG